jgi:predicted nicotinamide N-methyase
VPELRLHLADDMDSAWSALQTELTTATCRRPSGRSPGWAARPSPGTCSTTPTWCADGAVLDLATGSGLCALAAVLAGAAQVTAVDVDPLASRRLRS